MLVKVWKGHIDWNEFFENGAIDYLEIFPSIRPVDHELIFQILLTIMVIYSHFYSLNSQLPHWFLRTGVMYGVFELSANIRLIMESINQLLLSKASPNICRQVKVAPKNQFLVISTS